MPCFLHTADTKRGDRTGGLPLGNNKADPAYCEMVMAEVLERAGAALLIPDAEMTGARLVQEAKRLSADPGKLAAMGSAAKKFAKPGAAKRAAEILESLI